MEKFRIFWIILFASILLYSCERDDPFPDSNGKLKTKYIYSSPKDKEPYARTDYYYDESWNLIKDITVVRPDPVTFKNIYTYREGKLNEKRHYGIPPGAYPGDIKELTMFLYDKYVYDYSLPDVTIEKYYDMRKKSLKDSAVYEHSGSLLVKESHYYKDGTFHWGKEYQYDQEGQLIRENEYPEGMYTVFFYENGKKKKMCQYDKGNSLIVENKYVYTKENGYDIEEIYYSGPYGDFISFKSYYKNGLLVEKIKYHPTFHGAAWSYYRYEYY